MTVGGEQSSPLQAGDEPGGACPRPASPRGSRPIPPTPALLPPDDRQGGPSCGGPGTAEARAALRALRRLRLRAFRRPSRPSRRSRPSRPSRPMPFAAVSATGRVGDGMGLPLRDKDQLPSTRTDVPWSLFLRVERAHRTLSTWKTVVAFDTFVAIRHNVISHPEGTNQHVRWSRPFRRNHAMST